jgi:hypothetical protein
MFLNNLHTVTLILLSGPTGFYQFYVFITSIRHLIFSIFKSLRPHYTDDDLHKSANPSLRNSLIFSQVFTFLRNMRHFLIFLFLKINSCTELRSCPRHTQNKEIVFPVCVV